VSVSAAPFHEHLATFDHRSEAWQLAHSIAALLVRLGLTPDFRVQVVCRVLPGKVRWYVVELCGPAPLPAGTRSEIKWRLLATKEDHDGT
jgi:hypothetical protein